MIKIKIVYKPLLQIFKKQVKSRSAKKYNILKLVLKMIPINLDS